MKQNASITIDGWQIDSDRFCIARHGLEKKLEPRSMELLLYLAERAGEVVTRQQIEIDVWRGRVVGYDALSGSIAKIRKAFEDDRGNPRIIETIPKAGYRLIAAVETGLDTNLSPAIRLAIDTELSAQPAKNNRLADRRFARLSIISIVAIFLLIGAVLYLPDSVRRFDETDGDIKMAKLPSLAVLPFRSLEADPEQQFYSDGLTDDLITDLSNIDGLRVTPHHVSQVFGTDNLKPHEVSRELGVRYVVRGSVRRSFDEIRVNIQMVDALDEKEVWAQRFDDDIRNLFKLQDQIIREIVQRVGLNTNRKAYSIRGTTNLEAYDYYLRAEHRRQNNAGLSRDSKTIDLYRRAIELDPSYVNAYNGLAREALANWQLDANQIMPPAVSRNLVYESVSKALEVDSNQAEAWSILGLLQAISGEHDAGIASIESAISLDPSDPQLQLDYARALSYAGNHKQALAEINRAFELKPEPPAIFYVERAKILFFLGQFEQALADTAHTSSIRDSRNFAVYIHAAAGSAEAGQLATARLEPNPWENQQYYATIFAYYRRNEDIELIVESAASAGIPRYAHGFVEGNRRALKESEIRELVSAGLWHGTTHNGHDFFQQFTVGGEVALRTRNFMMSGPFHIEGNSLCVNFKSALLDQPDCGPVYQDSDSETFSWVTLGEIFSFEVEY